MTTTAATTHITSGLSIKRVAAYFKQSHKENAILVERRADGSFFLSDRVTVIAVSFYHISDLFPFTFFDANWQRATFPTKVMVADEGGPDITALWEREIAGEKEALTLTHYLWELPGARNKPGTLHRKFATYDEQEEEQREIFVKKSICDLLSPDLDELEGFLFEQAGTAQPVRVAAKYGYVGILMPLLRK